MSERKVLQKYYPPDFDPSKLTRQRSKPSAGPKQQTVRLMAPFSMKCLSCGEFIYKGRKFNARKENSAEKYLNISVFRFYIRCTRCSSEITFKTDPKNMDYVCEKGAVRNFEPWRKTKEEVEETEEERLDRLEREEMEDAEEEERGAMERLEAKTLDSKAEMAIADALDEIRSRNARVERRGEGADEEAIEAARRRKTEQELEREREEREIEEEAKKAFASADDGKFVRRLVEESDDDAAEKEKEKEKVVEVPSFKKVVKRKRDLGAQFGIQKKVKPLVDDYGSDSD